MAIGYGEAITSGIPIRLETRAGFGIEKTKERRLDAILKTTFWKCWIRLLAISTSQSLCQGRLVSSDERLGFAVRES